MNFELVKWIAGVLLTFAGIKFVWALFRELSSKEMMEDIVDNIGSTVHRASKKMTNALKKCAQKQKAKNKVKKEEKKEQPIIMIR